MHDVELFEIPGLRSFGGGASISLGGFRVSGHLARVTSGVGSETTLSASVGHAYGSASRVSVVFEHQAAAIGPSVSTLTSAATLLESLIVEAVKSRDHDATRIDQVCRWAFPLVYFSVLTFAVLR